MLLANALALVFSTRISIISLLINSLKNSSGGVDLTPWPTKRSGRRSLAFLGGLAHGKALKLGFDRAMALCLICTCSSQSWHALAVRFNGSLAYRTGSAKSRASSISPVSSSRLALSKTLKELSLDHQSKQKKASY